MEYQDKLIRGAPIKVGFFEIHPLTLGEIFDYGYIEYQKLLNYILFDVDQLDLSKHKLLKDTDKFHLFSLVVHQDKDFSEGILKALELFTKIQFYTENGLFLYKDSFINKDMWIKIREVISSQNNIKIKKQEEYNPANKRAEEMRKKIEANKQEIENIKGKKGDVPTLNDLVSALSAKHPSINLLNVWDLTYYQFVNQLERLHIVEEYDIAIQSLLAGADSKKVKAKHWTIKI